MSFFKRKDKIPPPPPPTLTPNQQRAQLFGGSTDHHYTPPPADDPYSSRHRSNNDSASIAPSYSSSDPYASRSQSNPATRVESDPARAALFAGYNPEAIPREVGRRVYGDREGEEAGGGEQQQEQEDEDVESIKRDIRGVKQESLGSTRNALRIAREAEETARGTLSKLGDQSERIASTERHLDLAKAASSRADDKTKELNKLNRSIFIPVVTFNKERKRLENERRITDRHIDETAERSKARLDVQQTQQRLNNRSLGGSTQRGPVAGAMAARKEARAKYQFEGGASDDELEDELDDNLEETLDVTRRLKALAVAAGSEIQSHNDRLTRINDKAENLDIKILTNVERLKKVR
ncbi:hypothetical protein BDY24DRAFT_407053 [Mrakia frigida]|uniref:uncharacterized protein n=1 Tax=Mrakia frigida TaxID=29902 RepID=UPI003FCC10D1